MVLSTTAWAESGHENRNVSLADPCPSLAWRFGHGFLHRFRPAVHGRGSASSFSFSYFLPFMLLISLPGGLVLFVLFLSIPILAKAGGTRKTNTNIANSLW